MCTNADNILSMPIWFNHQLNTKFDEVISQAGFNFMKDSFPKNQLIIGNFNGLGNNKIRKLKTIILKNTRGLENYSRAVREYFHYC